MQEVGRRFVENATNEGIKRNYFSIGNARTVYSFSTLSIMLLFISYFITTPLQGKASDWPSRTHETSSYSPFGG